MNTIRTDSKTRRLALLCGAFLVLPSTAVLLFHHEDRSLTIVMTALLVVGLFLIGKGAMNGTEERTGASITDDMAKLAQVRAPDSYLGADLAKFNEVFKPRLFGAFGFKSVVWIQNGTLRSKSLVRSRVFNLSEARGYAVFRFHVPREIRVLYFCDAEMNSRFSVDLLAFECHSLVRWAQENLADVSYESLR